MVAYQNRGCHHYDLLTTFLLRRDSSKYNVPPIYQSSWVVPLKGPVLGCLGFWYSGLRKMDDCGSGAGGAVIGVERAGGGGLEVGGWRMATALVYNSIDAGKPME